MIRRTLAATALAVAFLAVLPGAPAQARACTLGYQCTTNYYSDASQTTLVGSLYEDCDGSRYWWGTRTGYPTFTEVPC